MRFIQKEDLGIYQMVFQSESKSRSHSRLQTNDGFGIPPKKVRLRLWNTFKHLKYISLTMMYPGELGPDRGVLGHRAAQRGQDDPQGRSRDLQESW